MLEWITELIALLGYTGIATLMFLENLFPPVPSEAVMPFVGWNITQGAMTLAGVITAGTLGSVIASLPLYYAGRRMGKEGVTAWADRNGKWIGMSGRDAEKALHWFGRYGIIAVLFARFIPGMRSLVSIPAGVSGMSLTSFVGFTLIGSGLRMAYMVYLGMLLGQGFEWFQEYAGSAALLIGAGILICAVLWHWKRRRVRSMS